MNNSFSYRKATYESFNGCIVEKKVGLNAVMNKIPLYDIVKEEKAVSLQEREEDLCQFRETTKNQFQTGCYERDLGEKDEDDDDNDDDDDDNREEENELHAIQKRLDSIRRRRRRIQWLTKIECINQQDLLLKRLNERWRVRNQLAELYLSAWKGRDSVRMFLDCSKRWNVLNDCFSIWVDGKSAFATINGCRLGARATPPPTDLLIGALGQSETRSRGKWVTSANNNGTTNGNSINSLPRRSLLVGLFGSSDNTNSANNLPEKGMRVAKTVDPILVPLMEINAALGHACLLLKTIQESFSERDGNCMKFTHELHPMGATSKIGIRFDSPATTAGVLVAATGLGSMLSNDDGAATILTSPPVIYNLFFEESSGFSFFKNNTRNFNWALQAFLQCVAEAAAQQPDKTIAIPHPIHHKKSTSASNSNGRNGNNDNSANCFNGGEWTIGGLSICYPSQQHTAATVEGRRGLTLTRNATGQEINLATLEWTRACRYLLTNLKWLVAYAAKHVDR